MAYYLRAKIWLEGNKQKVFGDGPFDILKRIERTGSLRQAAAEINMSYSQAWQLIRMIENNIGFTLLEKQSGGPGGGFSTLTPRAKELTAAYDALRIEAEQILADLYDKHLETVLSLSDN